MNGKERERGVMALAMVLLLSCIMVLAALYVNRHLLVEQHVQFNIAESARSFEAAEAGIEWASAQLNNAQLLGADCLSASLPTVAQASSFRDRHLRIDAQTGKVTLATAATKLPAPHPACSIASGSGSGSGNDSGWICSCPQSGAAGILLPASSASAAPGFILDVTAGERPGVVRIRSTGCSRLAPDCATSSGPSAGSTTTGASFALVPALRTAPIAALTALGAVAFDTNQRPNAPAAAASDVVIQAGGPIDAGTSPLLSLPGDTTSQLVHNNSALAATRSPQLFASLFGMSKAHWKQQPAVLRLDCGSDCTRALHDVLLSAARPALIWVEGDVAIDGPMSVGTTEQPLVIVSTGSLQLRRGVQVHGLLYANAVSWRGATDRDAQLHGAIVTETAFTADAIPTLIRDADVLTTLQRARGSFVRLAGSWHDY